MRASVLAQARAAACAAACGVLLACDGNPGRDTDRGVTTANAAHADAAFLAHDDSTDVRVLVLNVGRNSIFPHDEQPRATGIARRPERFARVLRAVAPDIACLSEIHPPRTGAEAGALFDSVLPLPAPQRWHTVQVHDNVVLSRWPILQRGGTAADHGSGTLRGEAIADIAVPGVTSTDAPLHVICTHFQSSGGARNMDARQRHADQIVTALRWRYPPAGNGPALRDRPLLVLGDFNVYADEPASHLQTLLRGYRSAYRVPAGTPPLLTDSRPLHNAAGPEGWTWRNDQQPFPPGALDRMLYNDRVLEQRHAFVLNTTSMTDAALAAAGLQRDDVMRDVVDRIHDHLPLVADFRIRR